MLAIVLMAAALVILLAPMFVRGRQAVFFTATVEHRRFLLEKFERGDRTEVEAEIRAARRGARAGLADAGGIRQRTGRRRRGRCAGSTAAPLKELARTCNSCWAPSRASRGRC